HLFGPLVPQVSFSSCHGSAELCHEKFYRRLGRQDVAVPAASQLRNSLRNLRGPRDAFRLSEKNWQQDLLQIATPVFNSGVWRSQPPSEHINVRPTIDGEILLDI